MKKYFLTLLLVIGSIINMAASAMVELQLWADVPAPVSNGINTAELNDNPEWITNVSEPALQVFPAEKPNGTVLLMCPGGAYGGLAFINEGTDFAMLLNPLGITVAVLKYRMPNGRHQIPADDVRQAMRLLRDHAAEWGINPDRIGVGGASAGGHLASTVATHPDASAPKVAFQLLLYPVISMKEGLTHQGSRENLLGMNPSDELICYYSNEMQVTPLTPPAFIATSADDDIVPLKNSFDYFDSLTANGVDATMHIYPSGGHGWGCSEGFRYHQQWLYDLTRWISNLYE